MEHRLTTPDNTPYAALILRLGLGAMYVAHGLTKLLVFTLPGTVGFFESMGYPGFLAYVVTFAEIGGGLLLITGLYSRWVALALLPVLLGALQVHFPSGFLFSSEGGGWEYPAFLVMASLAQAVLGDGAYALRNGLNKARTTAAI